MQPLQQSRVEEGQCPQCRNWHPTIQGLMPTHYGRFTRCSGSGQSPIDHRVHTHSMDNYWDGLKARHQHDQR